MIFLFLSAILLYFLSAFVSYSPSIKSSQYFLIYGLGLALICNLIWLWIAKNTQDVSKLAIYGLYWDSIITFSFLAVPVLLFGVSFTKMQVLGVFLILAGIVLTKI